MAQTLACVLTTTGAFAWGLRRPAHLRPPLQLLHGLRSCPLLLHRRHPFPLLRLPRRHYHPLFVTVCASSESSALSYTLTFPSCADAVCALALSTVCTPGGYCETGSAHPSPCPAGTWSDRPQLESADQCFDCPPGSKCIPGSTQPEVCSPGTFSSLPGSPACDNCPMGHGSTKGERRIAIYICVYIHICIYI